MTLQARITTIVRSIGTDIKILNNSVGNLASLNTSVKNNIVNAINELKNITDILNAASAGINDTAGDGAIGVAWSADKIYDTIETAKTALINDLVNGTGPALNTLKKLQDALASDPNFANTVADSLSLRVRVDQAQAFNDAQKAQARSNISAAAKNDLTTLQTNLGQTDYDYAARYLAAASLSGLFRTYAKLNPDRKGLSTLLDNSLLSVSTDQYGCVISDIGKDTGKWYFEVICIDASQKATLFGVVNTATYNKNTYPGAPGNGWCYYMYNGTKYFNNTANNYGPNPAYNKWMGCYFDADAKTVGFIYEGVDLGIAFSNLVGTLHVIVGNGSSARAGSQVVNFGATPFAYTPPAGYNRGLYI